MKSKVPLLILIAMIIIMFIAFIAILSLALEGSLMNVN